MSPRAQRLEVEAAVLVGEVGTTQITHPDERPANWSSCRRIPDKPDYPALRECALRRKAGGKGQKEEDEENE
jgi:hypothetical protein